MKNNTLPFLVLAIGGALGWFLYCIGGQKWAFVYAAGFGPFLMAAAAAWDRQRSQ